MQNKCAALTVGLAYEAIYKKDLFTEANGKRAKKLAIRWGPAHFSSQSLTKTSPAPQNLSQTSPIEHSMSEVKNISEIILGIPWNVRYRIFFNQATLCFVGTPKPSFKRKPGEA